MQIIDTTLDTTLVNGIDETIAELELVVACGPLSIDMLTSVETCLELGLVETQVVDLVNSGRLAAYRFGGHLRFRVSDVAHLATVLRRPHLALDNAEHQERVHNPAA